MTIRHMHIFIEVYKRENITAAAEALHMTQPAVSRAIQEIERHYGTQLFLRTNRRLYVTQAGRELFAHALHIADTFSLMDARLRDWDTLGTLRVGASITLGNFLLPRVAAAMKQRHPQLRLQATVRPGEVLIQGLLHGKIDLAVIEGAVSHEQLQCEPFSGDELVFILSPHHPLCAQKSVKLEQTASCDLLLREGGSAGRTFLEHVFAAHELPLRPLWESVSTQAIVKAVSMNLGVSFLPHQLVAADLQAGRIASLPVEDANLSRTHALVWHRNKYLSSSARDFAELCRREAQRMHEENAGQSF